MTLEDRLVAEGYEVEVKGDGIRGEEAAKAGSHDLILLDVMLPGRDGFTVCRHLREHGTASPIIMLTARNTNIDVIMGLQQGADDYVMKPFDMGVLLARIEAALRRSAAAPAAKPEEEADSISFGRYTLDRLRGILTCDGQPIPLNAQEYRLLEYLALHPEEILSRDKILDDVWGYDSSIYTRTVDVHIAKLRYHLDESENPNHIRTVRGMGYRFIP